MRVLPYGCKIEDDERQMSVRLDDLGRWCTFRQAGEFYRRSLDGRIVIGADARLLTNDEHDRLHQRVIKWIHSLDDENEIINRAKNQTADDYQMVAKLYNEAYPEPVTILPPDRYQDVVLQPARGCPNRQCTFCAFYKDKPYQVLSSGQLNQHFQAVEQLLGPGFGGRDGVFLGSANALALSQRRLLPVLERIRQQVPGLKRGIACFADPDFSARRTTADWQKLADLGLRHVVIGLETGWPALRASLGKSGDLGKTTEQVAQLHSAGISPGITLLTGACEPELQSENIRRTTAFLEELNLTASDLVYLSPISNAGIVAAEALAEQQRLKTILKGEILAKVVPYQMQRFNYYA